MRSAGSPRSAEGPKQAACTDWRGDTCAVAGSTPKPKTAADNRKIPGFITVLVGNTKAVFYPVPPTDSAIKNRTAARFPMFN
jgi:hypothetical protein